MADTAAGLLGIPVIESRSIHWDAVYRTPDYIIVGEYGHLRHVIALGDILTGMRRDARALLVEFEASVGAALDGWGAD